MLCVLCRKPSSGILCKEHDRLYIYDGKNNWFRKRKRLRGGVRQSEERRKYHNTENKLHEIFVRIYGKEDIVSAVHPSWALTNTGSLLEYDIAVISKRLFVEYNGIQHYIWPNFFHKKKKDFLLQRGRDYIKTRLARMHGWRLLVIKYNEKVEYGNIYRKLKCEKFL